MIHYHEYWGTPWYFPHLDIQGMEILVLNMDCRAWMIDRESAFCAPSNNFGEKGRQSPICSLVQCVELTGRKLIKHS